ncbi:hypothetical protein TOPH_02394, partial [Tolypocladium ophioglossoides CBS 100239]
LPFSHSPFLSFPHHRPSFISFSVTFSSSFPSSPPLAPLVLCWSMCLLFLCAAVLFSTKLFCEPSRRPFPFPFPFSRIRALHFCLVPERVDAPFLNKDEGVVDARPTSHPPLAYASSRHGGTLWHYGYPSWEGGCDGREGEPLGGLLAAG